MYEGLGKDSEGLGGSTSKEDFVDLFFSVSHVPADELLFGWRLRIGDFDLGECVCFVCNLVSRNKGGR